MAWKKGPLPPDTYNWGGVTIVGEGAYGFYFADFCGDHVETYPERRTLKADEVAWYDNSLVEPPAETGVTGRRGQSV